MIKDVENKGFISPGKVSIENPSFGHTDSTLHVFVLEELKATSPA